MRRTKTGLDSAELWGPVARSGVGRPAAHSREEITAAAVAIADADGLAAVSIRRVAAAVGAGAMSLYSYVPDKETLIELMLDRVAGDVALAELTGDRMADLRGYARSMLGVMRRHPWLPGALATRQTFGPNTLAGLDHVLAILADTDLDAPAKLELVGLMTGFVANFAQREVAVVSTARRTGRSIAESAAADVAYLIAAAHSGRYPHLARALSPSDRPAAARPSDPDLIFDRLLERTVGALLAP